MLQKPGIGPCRVGILDPVAVARMRLYLRLEESRNCGSSVVYMGSGGATLVNSWQREKQE